MGVVRDLGQRFSESDLRGDPIGVLGMDGYAESGPLVQERDVQPGSADFEQVLALAARVLAQDRHLVSSIPGVQESHVLGAL